MNAEQGDQGHQRKGSSHGMGRMMAEKILVPVAAALASAAAGYAAKHGPRLFEEKVLPRLKQADLPKMPDGDRARDLVHEMNERAKSLVPHRGEQSDGHEANSTGTPRNLSSPERVRARKERAAHREARRRSSSS